MSMIEEISVDLKNDILLGFNLYKNENEKINKLKLRTLLFSFVMYKSSAGDINQFIEENTSADQEEFTYDEVCLLVMYKLKIAKDKEADEIFSYMNSAKSDMLTEHEIKAAFENEFKDEKIITPKEIQEMLRFMTGAKENERCTSVSREEFKRFYTDTK